MIMYDFNKLWILSGGDSTLIMRYFQILTEKREGWEFLVGNNYILNSRVITNPLSTRSAKCLAEYLGLCALRPYSHYKFNGKVSLPVEHIPYYVPKQTIEDCPWTNIVGSTLIFTKEETRLTNLKEL